MDSERKSLTPSLRADKLWSKLKTRAVDLRQGRLTVEFIIDQGQIAGAEIVSQRERVSAE